MDSLDLKPKNEIFFNMTEFYNKLKQRFVSQDEHENTKYLYLTLKMRSLSYMNDLHNSQDVILFCEIIENRFQII